MIRRWLEGFFTHGTIVLATMFLVFFCIDRVNPAMGFIDSEISKWTLLVFVLFALTGGILNAIRQYKRDREIEKRRQMRREMEQPDWNPYR